VINVSTRCRWLKAATNISTLFHRLLSFRSFTQPYSQNDLGVELVSRSQTLGYSDSTPLALSNDTNSFGVIEKNYREQIVTVFFSTKTSIEKPHEFAYARMSHDRVQPPLGPLHAMSLGHGIVLFARCCPPEVKLRNVPRPFGIRIRARRLDY